MSQQQDDKEHFLQMQERQTRGVSDLTWLVFASLLDGFARWFVIGAWLGRRQNEGGVGISDKTLHNLWWAVKLWAVIILGLLFGLVLICLIWGNY